MGFKRNKISVGMSKETLQGGTIQFQAALSLPTILTFNFFA